MRFSTSVGLAVGYVARTSLLTLQKVLSRSPLNVMSCSCVKATPVPSGSWTVLITVVLNAAHHFLSHLVYYQGRDFLQVEEEEDVDHLSLLVVAHCEHGSGHVQVGSDVINITVLLGKRDVSYMVQDCGVAGLLCHCAVLIRALVCVVSCI